MVSVLRERTLVLDYLSPVYTRRKQAYVFDAEVIADTGKIFLDSMLLY